MINWFADILLEHVPSLVLLTIRYIQYAFSCEFLSSQLFMCFLNIVYMSVNKNFVISDVDIFFLLTFLDNTLFMKSSDSVAKELFLRIMDY